MSLGGLTGAGGGSIAGSTPAPSQNQPDMSDLVSYARSAPSKADGSKPSAGSDDPDGARQASNDSGLDVPTDEQSQKLRAFDAAQGRPNVARRDGQRQDDGQEGKQEGSFAGCAAGVAKDVVVGTVKGLYNTAKDAGGAVLDQVGVDGYESHTERTVDRGKAVVDGAKQTGKAIMSPIDTAGKVVDATKAEMAEISSEIEHGDSCALGERVGTTIGVGVTAVVPGGALVKGGKVLAKMGGSDGPSAPRTADAPKPEDRTPNPVGGRDKTETPQHIGTNDIDASRNPHSESFGSVTGASSRRPFNPENAGGPILDLDYKDAKITKEGVKDVEVHINRYVADKPNEMMVERLHKIADGKIEATDYDRKFFTHERRELERYRNLGIEDGVNPGHQVWNDTHTATLEDFKLADFDADGNPNLYHPDTWEHM